MLKGLNNFFCLLLGMNMWSVTKLHEAAEMLMVPEWIVQLRHETTHGHMPGVTMLRAALEFALGWLDVHYWNYSDGSEPSDESQDEYSELHRLLECYMYLKCIIKDMNKQTQFPEMK